jgi:hypothetical protein
MNCTEVRNRLAELLYEDLPPADRERLNEHLAVCAQCRSEYGSLQEVQQTLNRIPVPEVSVSMPLLFRQVADRQARAGRRWRTVALTVSGLAAAIMLALAFRLEVRLDGEQVVIRWGSTDRIAEKTSPAPQDAELPQNHLPFSPVSESELQPLRGLIQTLTEDMDKLSREVDARDRRQQQNLARLQEQLTQLRMFAQRQVALTMADSAKKGDER